MSARRNTSQLTRRLRCCLRYSLPRRASLTDKDPDKLPALIALVGFIQLFPDASAANTSPRLNGPQNGSSGTTRRTFAHQRQLAVKSVTLGSVENQFSLRTGLRAEAAYVKILELQLESVQVSYLLSKAIFNPHDPDKVPAAVDKDKGPTRVLGPARVWPK